MLLLCAIAFLGCKSTPSNFIKVLDGTIDGHPIIMQLESIDGNITGSYYYRNKGVPITLKGETTLSGTTKLKEFHNGANTGSFTGEIADGAFSGTWNNAEETKPLKFLVVESTKAYVPQNEVAPKPEPKVIELSDYTGKWNILLECEASECSFSVRDERVAETWIINRKNENTIEIDVDGSKHKIKGYSCFAFDENNSVIDIESSGIGILGKYTKATGRIYLKDNNITGTLTLSNNNCSSQWNIKTQRSSPSVKF